MATVISNVQKRKLASRPDVGIGYGKWRITGTDQRGREWESVRFGFEADMDALIASDSVWTQRQLEFDDEQRGLKELEDGTIASPADFAPDNITTQQWRRYIARKWWKMRVQEDPDFMIKVAAYLSTFTATQLANALGISEAKAQLGLDRAAKINSIAVDFSAANDKLKDNVG